MSIAVTAPQKFDFQDVVCVDMMLRFACADNACFFVEPMNGEDGELQFSAGSSPSRMEIQVKGASGAVTLATVASCLAHTPARTADNTLLERLVADPTRLAVLVMSGRCDDAASVFAVGRDWTGGPHPDAHITAVQAAAVLSAFGAANIPGARDSTLRACLSPYFQCVACLEPPARPPFAPGGAVDPGELSLGACRILARTGAAHAPLQVLLLKLLNPWTQTGSEGQAEGT